MKSNKTVKDGLCKTAITLRAHQLLSTICVLGGAKCPLIEEKKARDVLAKVKADPALTIRLESNADEIPHYTRLSPEDYSRMDKLEVFNRKRDLDVLQRLGLVPGATRRARYLYTLLFQRIETPKGICAYDTPGWEGCALAKSEAYESVRAKGWKAAVYSRPAEECAEYRRRNVEDIQKGDRIYMIPHHLMCLCCSYNGGKGTALRPNDTLTEIRERIQRDPDVLITLVEVVGSACDCCDGFHPKTGRCVHAGGLIRNYKKDLDLFQKLGLMPGTTMKARELYALLFERVSSTRDICGYGDGVVRSDEWRICGGPEGNRGYVLTREKGLF